MNKTLSNILENINDNYDKSEGGFVYDLTKSVSLEFEEHKDVVDSILQKLDIENLEGDELDRFINQRTGLKRKEATYATTQVTITGNPLAIVHSGDLVAAESIIYEVVNETALNDLGVAKVLVKCQISGSKGNVPSNQITSFPLTLSGIVSVTNEENVSNGYDQESDKEIKDRYYEKLQKPGKAGNKYHYLEWARSVSGVGKAKVFPIWNGPLSIKVSILDSNMAVASPELIKTVEDYINSEKPFGATLTVSTGTELKINVSMVLSYDPSYLLETLKEEIKEKISEYFKSISFVSTSISHAMIGREILKVDGVMDYQNLLINGEAKNIQILEEQVPLIGVLTIT